MAARSGVVVLSAWVLAGCAFVDREVSFDYSAPARVQTAVAEAAARPAVAVLVRDVADRRQDTHRVGFVRNGFGMATADVHAKGDAVAWLRAALQTELERYGFALATSAGAADIVVDAALVEANVTAMFSYDGQVIVSASATRHGAPAASGTYVGKGSAGMNWSATDESFEVTLDLAVQDAVIQFLGQLRGAGGSEATAPSP